MYVRVKEDLKDYSYKSLVYAMLEIEGDRNYIVIDPNVKSFVLVSYISRCTDDYINPQIQVINSKEHGFVVREKTFLLKLKKYLQDRSIHKIDYFYGYEVVFNDYDFIGNLIQNGVVPIDESRVGVIEIPDRFDWNYIHTQEDANKFMDLFAGFHDSTIERIFYEENMDNRKLVMIVDNSGWYGIVELCFEGLLALNLRPHRENCPRELYNATLLVKDNMIFWADDKLENEDLDYQYSYIKAINLKWRKIE